MTPTRDFSAEPLLGIRNLSVAFETGDTSIAAVRDFSLQIFPGECIGVVGESGAGKTQVLMALMGLQADNALVGGELCYRGESLAGKHDGRHGYLRGRRTAMIFQDPMTSLTPHMRVGDQVAEGLVIRSAMGWRAARAHAVELLDRVKLPDAARRARQYPHELSGGMRQRVMIAIALACQPELLLADEPTTALDVTIQAQILALLLELKRDGLAIVLVTHDLGVVAGIADRVLVMYAGRVVEQAPVGQLFRAPAHPYSRALLDSMPRVDKARTGRLKAIDGQPPDPRRTPAGCAFAPRCAAATSHCTVDAPALLRRTEIASQAPIGDVRVACHHPFISA